MTLSDAKALFGFNDTYTRDDVNKKYKGLAIKFHPDKGGTIKQMQELNAAKEILLKTSNNANTASQYSNTASQYSDEDKEFIGQQVKKTVLNYFRNLNLEVFKTYFEKIFNTRFTYKKEDNFSRLEFFKWVVHGYQSAIVTVTFTSIDRTKIIIFNIGLEVGDLYYRIFKGTSLDASQYSVWYSTSISADKKVQKLDRTNYHSTNMKEIFTNPMIIFPQDKLEKIAQNKKRANSKLKKSDFEFLFMQKYNCSLVKTYGSSTNYLLNVLDGIVIEFSRNVMTLRNRQKFVSYSVSKPIVQTRRKDSGTLQNRLESIYQNNFKGEQQLFVIGYLEEDENTYKFFDEYLYRFSNAKTEDEFCNVLKDFYKNYPKSDIS